MVKFNARLQRHRFTPLADIQRYALLDDQRLFDTVFVYQKLASSQDGFNWGVAHESAAVDFAASLELQVSSDDTMKTRLTYDVALVPNEQAHLISRQFDAQLAKLVLRETSEASISSDLYSILPPKEATLPSSVELLHGMFEETAQRYPSRTALAFYTSLDGCEGVMTWTYRELDIAGNKVAHLIQSYGIKSGSVVAVCMEKCAEASFAFLGILKAGCSFLAMDPDLPEARKSFILDDSSARLLFLTEGTSKGNTKNLLPTIRLREALLTDLPNTALEVAGLTSSMTSYCLYTSGTTGKCS